MLTLLGAATHALFFGTLSFAQSPTVGVVLAKVPYQTSSNDSIYLTGDTDELCNWKPRCLKMISLGNGVFQANVTFPPGKSSVEVKVTRGAWSADSMDQYGNALQNTSLRLSDPASLTSVIQILGWKDRKGTTAPTTHFQVFPNFYSPQLHNTRSLRILVPESYSSRTSQRYPVIYMHDGQNLFDPATANSKVEWNVDETQYSEVRAGKVREAIIVGIDCTGDRMAEYDYSLKGQLYADFLIDTVKPFVDQGFRTLPGREDTYASGSSMGALISLSLIWRHPEVFSKAAGLSLPAFISDNTIYRIITPETKPNLPVSAYLDHGDYGWDVGYPVPDGDFIHYLLTHLGFPSDHLVYRNFPYADHFEADWARRFAIPLEFLIGTTRRP